MTPEALKSLRLALDPAQVLSAQGMAADPWQRRFLLSESKRTLLCCSRGAGKSRTTSAKALHRALFRPGSLILLISRAMRQSLELYRYVREGYRSLGRPIETVKETETTLELANGSRIVSLPGKEGTIRSYQGVSLLIIDEAARVPDDLYRSVRPMIGVSGGDLIALSTPWGKRGWFWEAWNAEETEFRKVRVTWDECPRLSREFIEQERRDFGSSWVRQEYECSFESLSGVVYPDFARSCCIDLDGPEIGKKVGGIDFGFRDPFAALWGTYDLADDLLTIRGEHYKRESGLAENSSALPAGHEWDCDPSQPATILELRRAGFLARKAFSNRIDAGIAAVRSRIERGKLKVVKSKCPNLLAEAQMYAYDPLRPGENPIDEYNHAMDALRYLVSRIDRGFIARFLGKRPPGQPSELGDDHPTAGPRKKPEAKPKPLEPSMTEDGPHWSEW